MKKKLFRIKPTKYPSLPLIEKMVTNLRIKFDESICIDAETWIHSHSNDPAKLMFRLSIVPTVGNIFQKKDLLWKGLLELYYILMKEGIPL